MSGEVVRSSGGASSDLKIGYKGATVQASQGVVHELTTWLGDHPWYFVAIMLFLMFWVWQARIGKRERSAHGVEFERLRRNIREAPQGRGGKRS